MKFAIVTGGTKGIGFGITKNLLGRGYTVVATYKSDNEHAKILKENIEINAQNLHIYQCDQAKLEEVYSLITFVKSITTNVNCIVCNAGMTVRKSFEETSDQDWQEIFNVSLLSNVVLIRELKKMIEDSSRIIMIGSMMGNYPHAVSIPYGVMKSSQHALTTNLVKEFVDLKTTVNAIAPGFVETEWQKDKPEFIRQNIYNKTASKRFASIDEIVSAFSFCMDNEFVNGSVIEVSGGYNYF